MHFFCCSLNHTRYDVQIPGIYKVLYHDIHHWYPDCNYSQYTMLWDYGEHG
jgi:sterol desaturase/sphingolipid hydroxylase (fatty acid hydroxylase superfamily)